MGQTAACLLICALRAEFLHAQRTCTSTVSASYGPKTLLTVWVVPPARGSRAARNETQPSEQRFLLLPWCGIGFGRFFERCVHLASWGVINTLAMKDLINGQYLHPRIPFVPPRRIIETGACSLYLHGLGRPLQGYQDTDSSAFSINDTS